MHGFSVSLLPLAGEALAGLQADVAPWAWPGCHPVSEVNVLPLPDGLTPIQPMPSKNKQAEMLIRERGVRSLCVHGDNPQAVKFVKALREGLTRRGFALWAFAGKTSLLKMLLEIPMNQPSL